MPKVRSTKFVATDLLEHPAVVAWRALQPARIEPDAIEVLKDKPGARVYRLVGVGPADTSVIAKQRRLGPGGNLVERTAYEEVFPRLPVPALRYFGFVADEDPAHGWLFLEDGGATRFSARLDTHRALAGRWLGYLHAFGSLADPDHHLPDRRSDRHIDRLEAGRQAILRGIGNPALTSEDVGVLRSLLALLDRLASDWHAFGDTSGPLPATLVLRNFVPRNSLIREHEGRTDLLIVDCESLAWGSPVSDLAQSPLPFYGRDFAASPDLTTYFEVVKEHWPRVDFDCIQRLASHGTLLRCVTTIGWEAPFLSTEWAATPMANMRSYHAILPHAMQVAGWAV